MDFRPDSFDGVDNAQYLSLAPNQPLGQRGTRFPELAVVIRLLTNFFNVFFRNAPEPRLSRHAGGKDDRFVPMPPGTPAGGFGALAAQGVDRPFSQEGVGQKGPDVLGHGAKHLDLFSENLKIFSQTHKASWINFGNPGGESLKLLREEPVDGRVVMFRGGTIVRDRSLGLYKKLLEHSVHTFRADVLVTMTQNPRVYESLRSFSAQGIAYPNPEREIPEPIKRIVRQFCRVPIDPDTLIANGVYREIRKDQTFKTNKELDVTRMFEALGEDDGFFVVVPLKA